MAEAGGARRVAVWDSPALTADCWTALGALSQNLSAMPIGLAVTNPVTRHPVVTANAARSIADETAGRMFLGIGSGDSGVVNLRAARSTLAYLREYVICVRALLTQGRAQWQGSEVYLAKPASFPVPIYVAAHGMRSVRTAAEIGDGILIGLGISPAVIGQVLDVVEDTCLRFGRDPAAVDLRWTLGGIAIAASEEKALEQLGWLVAPMSHHFSGQTPQSSLVPVELAEPVRILGRSYDLSIHGRNTHRSKGEYVRMAKDLGVWEYLRERFLVCGTAAAVGRQLQALAKLGASSFEVSTSACGTDGVAQILRLAQAVNAPARPSGAAS